MMRRPSNHPLYLAEKIDLCKKIFTALFLQKKLEKHFQNN